MEERKGTIGSRGWEEGCKAGMQMTEDSAAAQGSCPSCFPSFSAGANVFRNERQVGDQENVPSTFIQLEYHLQKAHPALIGKLFLGFKNRQNTNQQKPYVLSCKHN